MICSAKLSIFIGIRKGLQQLLAVDAENSKPLLCVSKKMA